MFVNRKSIIKFTNRYESKKEEEKLNQNKETKRIEWTPERCTKNKQTNKTKPWHTHPKKNPHKNWTKTKTKHHTGLKEERKNLMSASSRRNAVSQKEQELTDHMACSAPYISKNISWNTQALSALDQELQLLISHLFSYSPEEISKIYFKEKLSSVTPV